MRRMNGQRRLNKASFRQFTVKTANVAKCAHQQHSVRAFKKAARVFVGWTKGEIENGRCDEREQEIQKRLAA